MQVLPIVALGFVVVALLAGTLLIPPLIRWVVAGGPNLPSLTMLAIMLAIGMAWLASMAGSATIIGAFAAGLLLGRTPQAHDIRHGVAHVGHFFVPIFFASVGAAVELDAFVDGKALAIGATLIAVGIIGKFVAGYAPFWFKGRKSLIGIAMVPRGEVGLIFAQMGLTTGALTAHLYSAIAMMVLGQWYEQGRGMAAVLGFASGIRLYAVLLIVAAYAAIKRALAGSTLYRTSLKGEEIILSFISPQVGERYQATIKHIEESLEEKEREFLFQLKRQKRRREEAEHDPF